MGWFSMITFKFKSYINFNCHLSCMSFCHYIKIIDAFSVSIVREQNQSRPGLHSTTSNCSVLPALKFIDL